MTQHTHPYARVTLDYPTSMDRRQLRRTRRRIGQHLARLRQFADPAAA